MVHYLVLTQGSDGSRRTYDRRPPIQDSALVGTVLAAHAVQLYQIPGRERASKEALRKAGRWLAKAKPAPARFSTAPEFSASHVTHFANRPPTVKKRASNLAVLKPELDSFASPRLLPQ